MKLIRATEADAERICRLQQLAFAALLDKYQDGDLNPAKESTERIRQKLRQPETYYYFIEAEGETQSITILREDLLGQAFTACAEATEEAILNSLAMANTVEGYDGTVKYSLTDVYLNTLGK